MAALDERPFPPGHYPLIVVGSGPGGLQLSYSLSRLGIDHAVISEDEGAGGMFRRFPLFERLVTWSKPYATTTKGSREYEWHDWNSLLAAPAEQVLVADFMDGSSYFPARAEMQSALEGFVKKAGIRVRYGCRWESTSADEKGFRLTTSDGDYTSPVAVFAIGVSKPYKPANIPGLEVVPHYMDVKDPAQYSNKRVFIIGKHNSGFEIADGLLSQARQIYLASPSPSKLSILAFTTDSARARYIQPFEDHVFGGGTFVLDAAIERVERKPDGYRVFAQGTTKPGDLVIDVDEVIAATGVRAPLKDLAELGVKAFWRGGVIPRLTPYWESATVPGIYFAGGASMGAVGLKKYGLPSNSAAVHGFRYNARILARHLAEKHFGLEPERGPMKSGEILDFLLKEATHAPELWNQQSYLTRVVEFDPGIGVVDAGFVPLHHFVDAPGPDSVAITVETDNTGDIHPAVYIRRRGKVDEHTLSSSQLHDFRTPDHRAQLESLLKGFL